MIGEEQVISEEQVIGEEQVISEEQVSMVTLARSYACEICNTNYLSEQMALNCEKKGQPTIVFPRGLIFHCKDFNRDNGVCVYIVKTDSVIGHSHGLECWEVSDSNSHDFDAIEGRLKMFEFSKVMLYDHVPGGDELLNIAERFLIERKGIPALTWNITGRVG